MSKILGTFGDNVRKYRNKIGLSQEEFAKKCGLHRTYISAVERHRRSISLNNIQKIADALEIEPYLLFLEPHASMARTDRSAVAMAATAPSSEVFTPRELI